MINLQSIVRLQSIVNMGRCKSDSRRKLRAMLVEGLEPRQLMTTDLSALSLNTATDRISAQVAQPSEPLVGNQQLDQYKAGTMQTVASLVPNATGDTAESALSAYISQLKSPDASSGAQATDAAWSDFDRRFGSATANHSLSQVDALKQLSANPQSLQAMLIGSGFRQPVAPETNSPAQSSQFIADKSNVTSMLFPSRQSSAMAATSAKSLVTTAPVSLIGGFCNSDGTSGFSKLNEGGEGEPPVEGDDDGGSEIVIPQVDFPDLELTDHSGPLDGYSPASQATGQTVDTLGAFTSSTTADSDLTVPGVNFVHTVVRNWIDADHWSITETLIMGFNVSTTTSPTITSDSDEDSGSEDSGSGDSGDSSTGDTGVSTGDHPVTETASATITVNRSGFIILTFHAEKGMSTPVAGGVLWSVNLAFRDQASITLNASGGRNVAPITNSNTSTGTGGGGTGGGSGNDGNGESGAGSGGTDTGAGSGSTSPADQPLPANFTSTSSWSFNIGLRVWVNGTVSVSSTPSLVISATALSGTEVEHDIAYSTDIGAGVGLLVGSGWSSTSSSGDLNTPDPNTTFPAPPTGAIDPGFGPGSNDASNTGPIDVPDNGILTIDPEATEEAWATDPTSYELMPRPVGRGHQYGSSGNATSSIANAITGGLRFNAKVRGNDQLTALSGSVQNGFSTNLGDSQQDNKVLVFSDDGFESGPNWANYWDGTLAVGKNVSGQVSVGMGDSNEDGFGIGPEQNVVFDPLKDAEFFKAGISGVGFSFEHLSLNGISTTQLPGGGYTFGVESMVESHGKMSNSGVNLDAETTLDAPDSGELKLKLGNSGFQHKMYSRDYQALHIVPADDFIVSGNEKIHNNDRDSWSFTYSTNADTADKLNALGTVDPSGKAEGISTESFSYHSMQSSLRTINEINDGLWKLDQLRDANYAVGFELKTKFDPLAATPTTSTESRSGDTRVKVTGHENLDLWRRPITINPSDPTARKHTWNHVNLETGYRETYNGRGSPFSYAPENFDPRNDYERWIDGSGPEPTTGTEPPADPDDGGVFGSGGSNGSDESDGPRSSLGFVWDLFFEDTEKVFNNTEHMCVLERAYTVAGFFIADNVGVRGVSDACSARDSADGHLQSATERTLDGVFGSVGVVTTAIGLGAAGKAVGAARTGISKVDDVADSLLKNCFPAGTSVYGENGDKAIELVKSGEKVWAYDIHQSQWRLCVVLQTFESQHDGQFVHIGVNEETICSTAKHPFWVISGDALASRPIGRHITAIENAKTEGRWVDACDLRIGDELFLADNGRAVIKSLYTTDEKQRVFNFEVAELHTYAVGLSRILVHNDNGSAVEGGLNLFKFNSEQALKAKGWRDGDFFLHLPNQGTAAANWAQNSSRLREAMRSGNPIFDSYIDEAGNLIPTRGFLNAERELMIGRGWSFNPSTGAWHPPVVP